MIGGAADGSIQIWNARKVYSRPDVIIRPAHGDGVAVISVVISPASNNILASRGNNGTVMLWNLKSTRAPLKVFNNLPNIYPTANVEFRYFF